MTLILYGTVPAKMSIKDNFSQELQTFGKNS